MAHRTPVLKERDFFPIFPSCGKVLAMLTFVECLQLSWEPVALLSSGHRCQCPLCFWVSRQTFSLVGVTGLGLSVWKGTRELSIWWWEKRAASLPTLLRDHPHALRVFLKAFPKVSSLQSTTLMYVLLDLSSSAPIYFSKNTHIPAFCLSALFCCLSLSLHPRPRPPLGRVMPVNLNSAYAFWSLKVAVKGTRTAMGTFM